MHATSLSATSTTGKELPSHLRGPGKVSVWLIGISQPFQDMAKPLHTDPRRSCGREPLMACQSLYKPPDPHIAGAEPFSSGENIFLLKNKKKKKNLHRNASWS